MSHNILRLTRIHLKGSSGISEGFSSKDDRKWKRSLGLLATYVILGVLIIFLVSAISNVMAEAGFAEMIPAFVTMISLTLIFIFNVFRSGSTVFDLKLFEMEAALPVTSLEIVSSRFLVQYLTNLVLAVVIMAPGLIICGLHLPVFSSVFLIGSILGVLLTPLIPLTLSTAIGAVLYAISARMKHRKIVIIILGLALMVAAFVVYFMFISSNMSTGTALPTSLANLIMDQFGAVTGWCIPATLLSEGILGSIVSFIYYAALSIGVYVGLLLLVSWKYLPICQVMQVKDARNNYVMHDQNAMSLKKSLFRRDFKRYMSSTTYVFNTLFGYILMVVLGVAILCGRGSEIFVNMDDIGALPLFCALGLAALASMSSTTCASISIEGKNWWIIQTLPVHARDIYTSKIKVNFAVALPFYIIAEFLLFIALKPSVFVAIALLILPLAYIYFMSVFGLRSAVRHPKFVWNYETEAVKQGVGLVLSILVAFGTLLGALALMFFGVFISQSSGQTYLAPLFLCGVALLIFGIGVVLHSRLNKKEIVDIE